MKHLLLLIVALMWLPAAAHAEVCEGRIKHFVVTNKEELYPLGAKLLIVDGCATVGSKAAEKRILRFCPVGSYCHIAFTSEGDGEISTVDSVVPLRSK